MKNSIAIVSSLLLGSAAAFPKAASPALLSQLTGIRGDALSDLKAQPNANPSFNADDQLVDVSGIHEWRAPGPNDARGPCPGLNALANHGYLPRNGFASIVDFIVATQKVYGMGADLAVILSAYGGVIDGLVAGWSIAGEPHIGIGGSHGNYETDNSPMRGDLNQYGSNSDLVISQFKELFDMQPDAETANYNIDVLSKFRGSRFRESIAKNPWFYYGPFSGTTVSQAAFSFIYRFMANHTAEAPEGILNQDVLKSFFAVSGDSDNLVWTRGHERIPENWYRRAQDDTYGTNGLSDDTGTFEAETPEISKPGCNTGKVDTYTNIDSSFSDYDFTQPTAGPCFAVAQILDGAGNVPVVNVLVDMLVLPLQNALDCVTVPSRNDSVGDVCPGYSLYGGPTGEIAPGTP